jgi:SAM-dependent methyltransferase
MAKFYDNTDDLSLSLGWLSFLTANSRVLEFGSATGYATRYMREKLNCKVTCIEISSEMAEIGKQYATKMIVSDIESYSWENELEGDFDFIVFADVLEHLRNPAVVILKATKHLKKSGFILSSIPNVGHNAVLMNLRNGVFNYTETGLLDNTHIHLMTRDSVTQVFESSQLYCVAENHKIIRPLNTEMECYYIQHPLLALSIIRKADAHIYQFVHKWSLIKPVNILNNNHIKRYNCIEIIFELCYDAACFIKRRLKINTK